MMMRVFAVSAAGLVLAACSGAADNPLLGSWHCEIDKDGQKISGDINYASGGKESGVMSMSMSQPGADVAIDMTFTGTWKLRGDQLEEEIVDLNLVSAKVNGLAVADGDMAPFIAGMKGQTTTSTIAVSKDVLALKSMGETSTCSR